MRNTLKILLSIFMTMTVITGAAHAQTAAVKQLNLKLTAERPARDAKGTDETNIYRFTVNLTEKTAADPTPYTIIYFLDDQPIEQWLNQTLPFSFERNFKGLNAGPHTIKIDIEDANNTVIATDSVTINVITRGADKR